MYLNQQGFSLMEVLIATAISSLLLISASRFTGLAAGCFTAIRSAGA